MNKRQEVFSQDFIGEVSQLATFNAHIEICSNSSSIRLNDACHSAWSHHIYGYEY